MDYLIPLAALLFVAGLCVVLWLMNRSLLHKLQQARKAEHRYRLLWQQLPDVITELDTDGRILGINHLMNGFTRESVVGRYSHELLAPEQNEVFEQNLQHTLETLSPSSYELQLHGAEGQVSWLRNQLVPVVQDGELAGLLVIGRDVTDMHRAQEVLGREKEAALQESLAKSRFLASMSHEIRTPMTGLIGMVSLLEQTPLNTEQLGFVRVIQQSSEHLLSIVNDILDSSKIDANMLSIEEEAFAVRELVDNLVNMMAGRAREKGLAIQSFVDANIPRYLLGDPVRIRQILMNYLTNALKFTEHGHVLLRLVLVSQKQSRLRIRFSVEDSGIGISTEQALHIFDEYSPGHGRRSTLAGGTGLGLSICRRLASLMGGKVGVVSSVGLGSHFWLDLELMPAASDLGQTVASYDFGDREIWVLDDVQINRSLVVSVARNIPVSVREFTDFDYMLSAAREKRPDVLIVCERCFQGHAEQLRSLSRQNVTLAISSSSAAIPDEKLLTAAGVRAFWDWPVGQEVLRRMLLRLLEGELPEQGLLTRYEKGTPQVAPVAATAGGLKVLLAEDNMVNQKVAAQMLRRLGCDVVVAADGKAALDQCRKQSFDLVLMDCHMPVMDGLEATRAIRELPQCSNLPVLALSADVMAEQKSACEAAGMNGYLTKPVRIEDLRAALEPYAAARSQSAAP